MKVWLNHKIVPLEKAKISVLDRSFLYGDGIYETLRVYKGKPFLVEKHLARLFQSAERILLKLPWSGRDLKEAIVKVVRANKLQEAVVRMTISRGVGPRGLDPRPCQNPTLVILTFPFVPYPASYFTRGIDLMISSIRRNHRMALNPTIKSNNFLNNILAWMDAHRRGGKDGIFLNVEGFVAEGTTSNIFLVKNNVVITPSLETGILPGVTRSLLLDWSKKLGFKTKERLVKPQELFSAQECFLTGTTIEVLPIRSINKRLIRKGRIGPVTKALYEHYQRFKYLL